MENRDRGYQNNALVFFVAACPADLTNDSLCICGYTTLMADELHSKLLIPPPSTTVDAVLSFSFVRLTVICLFSPMCVCVCVYNA